VSHEVVDQVDYGQPLLEKRTQVEGVGLNAVWDQKARRMGRNVNLALEYQT
jgi:hypothetical protein